MGQMSNLVVSHKFLLIRAVCKICVVKNHIAAVIHTTGQVKEIVGIFQTGGGVKAAVAAGI